MNAGRDRKKVTNNMTTILHRLEVLERQQTQLIDRIRIGMTARANEVETKLCEFLNSEDLRRQFIYQFSGSDVSRLPGALVDRLLNVKSIRFGEPSSIYISNTYLFVFP